jgi:hypothetical protein
MLGIRARSLKGKALPALLATVRGAQLIGEPAKLKIPHPLSNQVCAAHT